MTVSSNSTDGNPGFGSQTDGYAGQVRSSCCRRGRSTIPYQVILKRRLAAKRVGTLRPPIEDVVFVRRFELQRVADLHLVAVEVIFVMSD